MLRAFLGGLLDLLAPPRCAACKAPIEARAAGFCEACRILIEPALLAERAVWDDEGDPERDLDACLYGGPLREALQRFKYEGASELAPQLAQWLEPEALTLLGRIDCVAVVPLHPRRLRARGYNQSALLARPVAELLSVPFLPGLMRRVRDTPAQVGLGRRERRRQLAEAFVASPRARARKVLVIDDVRTTGATFEEARRALLAAGAHEVFTLALACTRPDLEPVEQRGSARGQTDEV